MNPPPARFGDQITQPMLQFLDVIGAKSSVRLLVADLDRNAPLAVDCGEARFIRDVIPREDRNAASKGRFPKERFDHAPFVRSLLQDLENHFPMDQTKIRPLSYDLPDNLAAAALEIGPQAVMHRDCAGLPFNDDSRLVAQDFLEDEADGVDLRNFRRMQDARSVASLEAMNAGGGQFQRVQQAIDHGKLPSRNHREGAIGLVVQRLEQPQRRGLHAHVVRMLGDLRDRAVEVQEDRVALEIVDPGKHEIEALSLLRCRDSRTSPRASTLSSRHKRSPSRPTRPMRTSYMGPRGCSFNDRYL